MQLIFTSLLYLTIGHFSQLHVQVQLHLISESHRLLVKDICRLLLIIFTLLFFGVTLWLSLNPAKIVDRVGKILSPAIIILLLALLVMVIVNQWVQLESPQDDYASGAFMKGFTEGYNTMDALASLVFGIIVINAIRSMGVTSKRGILTATANQVLLQLHSLQLFM